MGHQESVLPDIAEDMTTDFDETDRSLDHLGLTH